MTTLDALLAVNGGVFHLGRRPGLRPLTAGLRGAGWQVSVIDGRVTTTKASLLGALASELAFPEWFGHNWDALADCLSELSRVAIVVNHPGAHSAFDTLAEIVGDLSSGGQAILLVMRPGWARQVGGS